MNEAVVGIVGLLWIGFLIFGMVHMWKLAGSKGESKGKWLLFTFLVIQFGGLPGIILGNLVAGPSVAYIFGFATAVGGFFLLRKKLDDMPDWEASAANNDQSQDSLGQFAANTALAAGTISDDYARFEKFMKTGGMDDESWV